MKYSGKLYGKIGRNYIQLVITSEELDAMERERDEARDRADTMFANHVDILDQARRERDEAREQRTKAVEKYQASIKEMHEVGMQRDRLATALRNLCDSFLGNKSSRDITAQLVEAGKALATLNQSEL